MAVDTEITKITHDAWVRRVITWQLTGDTPRDLRLRVSVRELRTLLAARRDHLGSTADQAALTRRIHRDHQLRDSSPNLPAYR